MHSASTEARRRPERLRRIAGVLAAVAISVAAAAPSAPAAGELLVYDPDPPGSLIPNEFAVNEGYSNFAAAAGLTKTDSTTLPADQAAWDVYECVVLPIVIKSTPAGQGFLQSERDAIMAYVQRGGTVVALAEHSLAQYSWPPPGTPGTPMKPKWGEDSVTTFNPLASQTGIQALRTSVNNGGWTWVTKSGAPGEVWIPDSPPAITGGVNYVKDVQTIGFGGTTTLTVTPPAFPLVMTKKFEIADPPSTPFIAMRLWGLGKFVYSGDANVFSDHQGGAYPYADNGFLARNVCGDINPPIITITTPQDGKRYSRDLPGTADDVAAAWTCTDTDSDIDDSLTTATTPVGQPIDRTIPAGTTQSKSFTVSCTDMAGNSASKTVNYVVDGRPPVPVIESPVAGHTYNRGSLVPAAWHCEDPDGPADIDLAASSGTKAPGEAIDTTMPGGPAISLPFSVTCVDKAGNTTPQTVNYFVADQNPPVPIINSPLDGARYTIGKPVNAGWLCTDPDGPQDIDQAASFGSFAPGELIDTNGIVGQSIEKLFSVTCKDLAGNTTTVTHKYVVDGNPPIVTIAVPLDGGSYPRGSNQPATWSCTDPDGQDDVATQVATLPVGTPVNTSTMGQKTFSVTCTDKAGNATTKVVTYNVTGGPPTVTITIPADKATFDQGQVVSPSYSCADPDGDLKSCVREGATGPLDTSKGGTFKLTINAEDSAGNKAAKTHTYTVKAKGTVAGTTTSPTTKSTKKVCTSRRQFRIRVKKIKGGHKAVSATVFVNGKKTTTRRGKRITATVTLKGLKKGTYNVRVRVKYSNGRTLSYTRKFKTCTPKGK